MLRGKKIILGVCGSIAAYKSALLVRLFIKHGAEVKVIMTSSALSFITPLTLATLSRNPVLHEFTSDNNGVWNNHVELGLWADHIIIAPASATTIAKMAQGICDNLLISVYLSARCPVSIAPAMDLDMLAHPSVQNNLQELIKNGNTIIPAESGELASGLHGQGRMAEPENILQYLENAFGQQGKLLGKRILITAGPTQEPIDPVRYISNHSSGKMGYELAKGASAMGGEVTLISGPVNLPHPHKLVELVNVNTAQEMYAATNERFEHNHIIIYAAAVADYTPEHPATEKIKKSDMSLNLGLRKTVDIAAETMKLKQNGQVTIGFALETQDELENAKSKLKTKNFDMIVLNSALEKGAGFKHDTNKITLIKKDGEIINFELKPKSEVAKDILETITQMIHD